MANAQKPAARATHHAVEPHVAEHGVWGYDTGAVGGFGENYDAQVARGEEPSLPEASPEEAALASAVQNALGEAHLEAADLRVVVNGAHVTLYGSVREDSEKAQLDAVARAVSGVGSLSSRLSVSGGFALTT